MKTSTNSLFSGAIPLGVFALALSVKPPAEAAFFLLAGAMNGADSTGSSAASEELYDSTAWTWSTTGSLNIQRKAGHSAEPTTAPLITPPPKLPFALAPLQITGLSINKDHAVISFSGNGTNQVQLQASTSVTGIFTNIGQPTDRSPIEVPAAGKSQFFRLELVIPPNLFFWADYGFNQNGNALVTGVAVDHLGDTVFCGYFNGTLTLLGHTLNSSGNVSTTDGFLCKVDSLGAFLWIKQIGSAGSDAFKAVAVDSRNNILVDGNFQNSVDFGCGSITASHSVDAFVVKYSPAGVCQWATNFPGLTADVGATIAVDASDNPVLLLDCSFNSSFGGIPMTPAGGAADIDAAVGKLNGSTGVVIWARRFGGVNWENARAVSLDHNGDVLCTGYFYNGQTDLGGGTINGAGGYGPFLARYSGSDGAFRWGFTWGAANTYGYGLATHHATGDTYVTGLGPAGIYVTGFDASGHQFWSVTTGASGDSGMAVSISDSSLEVCGLASSAIYFGGNQSVFGNGQANGWLAGWKIDGTRAPTWKWTRCYGFGLTGASQCLAISAVHGTTIGGSWLDTIDFGGGPVTAAHAGYSSAVVSRYSPQANR